MKKGLLLTALLIVGWATSTHAGWERMDTLRTYWPNGQLKEQWTEVPDEFNQDGSWWKEGLYQSWYEDGRLSIEMSYHWDHPEGWFHSWYASGQLREEGRYFATKQGTWITWSESGYRTSEIYYSGDSKYGVELSFNSGPGAQINGERYYCKGKLHGVSWWDGKKEFYFHGELLAVLWAAGMQQLDILERGSFYNKQLDLWFEWDTDFTNPRVGKKVDGKKVGIWERWTPPGEIILEKFSDE